MIMRKVFIFVFLVNIVFIAVSLFILPERIAMLFSPLPLIMQRCTSSAFPPAVAFWVLDGYFLWQERMYRKLYDAVRKVPDDKSDFSMNAPVYKSDVSSWLAA